MRSSEQRGTKHAVKQLLGDLPLTAEAYWLLRQRGKPLNHSFNLRRLEEHLPEWKQQAAVSRANYSASHSQKHLLIFATLRYWIEHAVMLGMGLSGLGHDVTLAYLPYSNWQKPLNRFDQRRQDLYARSVLSQTSPLMNSVSFYHDDVGKPLKQFGLPSELVKPLEAVTIRDVQYTRQVEEVDENSELFRFRLQRNFQAARYLLKWIHSAGTEHPHGILTPNGSILEMGAVFVVARFLDIPIVTYEFGEQRDRIWLAQNSEVMLQNSDKMWAAYQQYPLTDKQWDTMRALYAARQDAGLWANFSRTWQGQPQQGGERVRGTLGLDERPVVLLAANVIGDSLTLGRQVFSESMTEWLERTVHHFLDSPDVQLVVRIHPGEKYTKGPSVANIVRRTCLELPEHIHVIEANDPTNTYDIAEIASMGLVYTTTTGMEMAMHGLPVIVAGQTHYRGKGFTLDPTTWQEYFSKVRNVLNESTGLSWRLSQKEIELAWQYAYRFFFTFPMPFPWHLVKFWKDLPEYPIEKVLSPEGQEKYGESFRCLAGEPRIWDTTINTELNLSTTNDENNAPDRLFAYDLSSSQTLESEPESIP